MHCLTLPVIIRKHRIALIDDLYHSSLSILTAGIVVALSTFWKLFRFLSYCYNEISALIMIQLTEKKCNDKQMHQIHNTN